MILRTMARQIIDGLVEYFGSLLAIPAVLDKPLREDNGQVAEGHERSGY
jgi:hypothetical protein